jgi:hypothetical protein
MAAGALEALVLRVWDSIVTPGTSRGLLVAINVALVGLAVALGVTWATGHADVHTAVMAFLAVGLAGSVNWFVYEMWAAERAAKPKAA